MIAVGDATGMTLGHFDGILFLILFAGYIGQMCIRDRDYLFQMAGKQRWEKCHLMAACVRKAHICHGSHRLKIEMAILQYVSSQRMQATVRLMNQAKHRQAWEWYFINHLAQCAIAEPYCRCV